MLHHPPSLPAEAPEVSVPLQTCREKDEIADVVVVVVGSVVGYGGAAAAVECVR